MYELLILTRTGAQLSFAFPRKRTLKAFRNEFERTYGMRGWAAREPEGAYDSGGELFLIDPTLWSTLIWNHAKEKGRR